MTMTQAVIRSEMAWVVTDSICQYRDSGEIVRGPDGLEFEDQKLFEQPRFILTSLGSLALRHYAQARAHELPDIDAAIERLPEILRRGYSELGLHEQQQQTVIVVGWSTLRGHMTLASFKAEDDFRAGMYGSADANGYTFWRTPDIPREPFCQCPDDRESLIENAQATSRHWRDNVDSATPVGGALRMAEISKDSILISTVGHLGMPAKRGIAAVTLALAACGGSADPVEIEGAQLVANAATDSGKITPANGTRTSFTYSGAATTLWQDDATLTYVNTAAVAVEVEVFGSMTWWVSVAAAGYVIGPSFRGTNDVTDISDSAAIGTAGTTSPAPYSFSRSFTVAAGKTLTLKISSGFKTAGSGASGGVYNWNDMLLKYNALKR